MPVRELLARIGSDELTEWMAFYQLEPFGDLRADLRSGVISSTIANANRAKHSQAFTPEDFMPFTDRRNAEITPQNTDSRLNQTNVNVARFKAMFAHRIKKHG